MSRFYVVCKETKFVIAKLYAKTEEKCLEYFNEFYCASSHDLKENLEFCVEIYSNDVARYVIR